MAWVRMSGGASKAPIINKNINFTKSTSGGIPQTVLTDDVTGLNTLTVNVTQLTTDINFYVDGNRVLRVPYTTIGVVSTPISGRTLLVTAEGNVGEIFKATLLVG